MDESKRHPADLFDLALLLLKYKRLILFILVLGSILPVACLFLFSSVNLTLTSTHKNEVYISECLIEPEGITAEKLKATFLSNEIEKRFLSAVVKSVARVNKVASVEDNGPDAEIITPMVKVEGSFLRLTAEALTTQSATKQLEVYLSTSSDYLRERALAFYEVTLPSLKREISSASDPVLKAKLSERFAQLFEGEKNARNAPYYGFSILDPPSPPKPAKSSSTPRQLSYRGVFLLSILASFLIAVFLAFCIESVERLKKAEPGRYEQFRKALRFGRER